MLPLLLVGNKAAKPPLGILTTFSILMLPAVKYNAKSVTDSLI